MRKLTQKDVYEYLSNGGDMYIIPYEERKDIPQYVINKYVSNGGDLGSLTKAQREGIPQDIIQKYVQDGGSWSYLTEQQKEDLPQDLINEHVIRTGEIYDIPKTKLKDIPKEILGKYYLAKAENLSSLENFDAENIIYDIPEEYAFEHIKICDTYYFSPISSYILSEDIPQEVVNQRVANGLDTYGLDDEQIDAVPPEYRFQGYTKGGHLSDEELKEIDQKYINQKLANNQYLHKESADQRNKIPQEVVNQCFIDGHEISKLMKEVPMQMGQISQDCVNQRFMNNRDMRGISMRDEGLHPLTIIRRAETSKTVKGKLSAIPPHLINEFASKHGGLSVCSGLFVRALNALSHEQLEAIPSELKEYTETMKNAVILYGAGEITKDELPIEVFANYETRKAILAIIKSKTIQEFNKICKKYGFVEEIPNELKEEFNARVKEIESEVEMAREGAIEYLETGKIYEIKEDKKKPVSKNSSEVEEIQQMGW